MKALTAILIIALSFVSFAARADEASQRATAEELLEVMKADQMRKPLLNQVRTALEQQFVQMGATDDMRPILKKYTDRLFGVIEERLNSQAMKENIISVYIQTFSEDELRGMVTFYRSPLGQAVINKMPIAMQRTMEIQQKNMPQFLEKVKQISEEFAQEIKAEMEKKKSEQNQRPEKAPAKRESGN